MQINGILHDLQGGTTELEKLQQKVADAQQEFDHLLDLSLEMQCVISGRTHSHVLPALIRRFHEAKVSGAKEVVCWGTGTPLREFRTSGRTDG